MKHLQASGAKQGQWVTCNAKVKCRNGGTHVDDNVLTQIQENFKAEGKTVPVSKITEADVRNFQHQETAQTSATDFQASLNKINEWLDTTYPEVKAQTDTKILQVAKRKYTVPRPDFVRIEEKLQKGETLFRGSQVFQIGIVLAPNFRQTLIKAGLTYKEDKVGWGERLFTVRYNNASTARAYCSVARMIHWMECEDIADGFEADRQRIVSRNRILKATFRKPIEVPLADYSKEDIAEGLFDGSLVHRKIDERVYILENPIINQK